MKKSIFHNAMRRRRFFAIQLAIQCLLLLPLSVASTYTWFFLSKTPSVNDIWIGVQATDGLMLAWEKEPTQWQESLSYQDVSKYNTVLRPVTYSYLEDAFYLAKYDASGRIENFGQKADEIKHANRADDQGYLLKFDFYAHTEVDVTVNLADAEDGTGTYLREEIGWDENTLSHYSMSEGAEKAMRIGLRIIPIDIEGEELSSEKKTVIYEPNSDSHVNGGNGYLPTPSIDGSDRLIPDEYLYAQGTTTWTEHFPVKKDTVVYSYGQFLTENERLFSLNAGNTVKIEVIVWLEGQDKDCSNTIAEAESHIFANIAFRPTRTNDPGYVE